MREIRTSGSTRGSGRRALLHKRRLSLSTLLSISGSTTEFRLKGTVANIVAISARPSAAEAAGPCGNSVTLPKASPLL